MKLTTMMLQQDNLQAAMGYPMGLGVDGIKENLLWMQVEIGEVLQELHCKPWKYSASNAGTTNFDRQKVLGELVDVMQFYINVLNLLHVSPDEFNTTWEINQQKCLARLKANSER